MPWEALESSIVAVTNRSTAINTDLYPGSVTAYSPAIYSLPGALTWTPYLFLTQ